MISVKSTIRRVGRYSRMFVIPRTMWEDSQFPFRDGQEVVLTIINGQIRITKA